MFVSVTVQEKLEPAETVWVAGVFVIPSVGHPTVTDAVAGLGAVPLPSVTVAVLLYVAQDAEVVLLITCTDVLAPAARLLAE